MVHLWRPMPSGTVRFPDRELDEGQVEFRKLRWASALLPPMVMKRLHGREWGSDPLTMELRRPAAELEPGVGAYDPAAGVVRTTGVAGTLVTTPPAPLLPGRYRVDLYGKAIRLGSYRVDLVAGGGSRRIGRRTASLKRIRKMPQIGDAAFHLKGPVEDVRVRLWVDDAIGLEVERIDINHVWGEEE
ncbi:MAG: hypothetical protein JRI25_21890 [Deltaproteobacteria bacterium]|nr:hypothetical protein [Deltaproteobacteria bacterium]